MGTHPIFESDFDCLTDEFEMLSLINSRRDGVLNGRSWQPFGAERRPISLESVRDVATYQRFAFLTAITGVTSFVLFGMTVMANDKMNLNLQVIGSASRYIAWTLDGALCRPYHSFITIVRISTPWSTLGFDFWLLCFRSSQRFWCVFKWSANCTTVGCTASSRSFFPPFFASPFWLIFSVPWTMVAWRGATMATFRWSTWVVYSFFPSSMVSPHSSIANSFEILIFHGAKEERQRHLVIPTTCRPRTKNASSIQSFFRLRVTTRISSNFRHSPCSYCTLYM